MSRLTTVPALEQRHAGELLELVRAALESHGWRLLATATALEKTQSWLRRYVESEPALAALYAEKNPGRGRPARGEERNATR